MKISTKGRYALRLMVDLAEHKEDGFIALKDIAKRQNVSKKYLEQIVPVLNGAGLLTTNRGNKGGYRLSKEPSEYTVGDILRTTEGSVAPVSCLDSDVNICERQGFCQTFFVWEGLYKVVNDYLDGITVQDIVDKIESVTVDYII